MSELRSSLEANDLRSFERILANKANRIAEEPFLMTYIEPLRRRMQEQVLLSLVRPYETVKISFLSMALSLEAERVWELLVDLITDERLAGAQLDQTRGLLQLNVQMREEALSRNQMLALGSLSDSIAGVLSNVASRIVT